MPRDPATEKDFARQGLLWKLWMGAHMSKSEQAANMSTLASIMNGRWIVWVHTQLQDMPHDDFKQTEGMDVGGQAKPMGMDLSQGEQCD
jgi:hypothetical protein